MIEQIIYWTGAIIIILILLFIGVFLIYLIYKCYDYWLKKLLGWNRSEVREDIFYFVKHKKEIREIIQNLKQGGKK